MAWLILVLLVTTLTFAASNEVCMDDWKPIKEKWYANGHLYDLKSPGSKVLIKKNLKGEPVGEIELPRVPTHIDLYTKVKDGFVYTSDDKFYYFNEKTKKEMEVGNGLSRVRESSLYYEALSDGNQIYYDLKSLNSFKIPPMTWPSTLGSKIFYITPNQEGTFIDTVTKKEEKIASLNATSGHFLSDNLIRLNENSDNESPLGSYLVKEKGNWKVVTNTPEESITGALMTGEILVAKIKRKDGKEINAADLRSYDPEVHDLSTEVREPNGKVIKTLPGGYLSSGTGLIMKMEGSGQLARKFYGSEYFSQQVRANKIPAPQGTFAGEYSIDDTQKWITFQDAGSPTLLDLVNNKKYLIPEISETTEIAHDGDKVTISDDDKSQSFVVDLKTGAIKKLSNTIGAYQFDNTYSDYLKFPDNARGLHRRTPTCFGNQIKIVENDCDCLKNNNSLKPTPHQVTLVNACNYDISSWDWDLYTPSITEGEISKKQAQLYLNRFQKKDGYSDKFLPILISILKSDMVEKNTYEVMEALKTIPPETVEKLFISLNLEKRLPKTISKTAFICRDHNEKKAYSSPEVLSAQLTELAASNRKGTDSYKMYLPFRYDLQDLSKAQKTLLIDQIAENISQNASEDRAFAGVFPSKLYYFAKKFALNLFGEEFKPATDISVSQTGGNNSILILSSGPIDGDKNSFDDATPFAPKYGFYYQSQNSVKIPEDSKPGTTFSKKVEWQTTTDKYSADIQMKVQESAKEIVPRNSSPNYSAMKKDGAKTGLMIIGSNLASNVSLGDEYLTYYQNEGFKFDDPKEIDTLHFFENEVKNGNIDYFIKEAHSDGDEKNLFRINNKGILLTGTRLSQDGTKEVIHLVSPSKDNYNTTLISNHRFGEWIKARGNQEPLYYFNASCNSDSKVINEISAISSPNFVPIATASLAYTFSTKKTNAMNAMLTAFRNENDYSGIRQQMKTYSPRYAGGREDQFIFPDEEKYESRILENLSLNLDTKIEIKDSKGKEIHMDEQLDHD